MPEPWPGRVRSRPRPPVPCTAPSESARLISLPILDTHTWNDRRRSFDPSWNSAFSHQVSGTAKKYWASSDPFSLQGGSTSIGAPMVSAQAIVFHEEDRSEHREFRGTLIIRSVFITPLRRIGFGGRDQREIGGTAKKSTGPPHPPQRLGADERGRFEIHTALFRCSHIHSFFRCHQVRNLR